MKKPLLEHPAPDFAELEWVLKGKQEPRRVHLVELLIEEEVLQAITERYLGGTWILSTADTLERYFQQFGEFYCRLGYDYVPIPQWPLIGSIIPLQRGVAQKIQLNSRVVSVIG